MRTLQTRQIVIRDIEVHRYRPPLPAGAAVPARVPSSSTGSSGRGGRGGAGKPFGSA